MLWVRRGEEFDFYEEICIIIIKNSKILSLHRKTEGCSPLFFVLAVFSLFLSAIKQQADTILSINSQFGVSGGFR
jgi:hypothetical protein